VRHCFQVVPSDPIPARPISAVGTVWWAHRARTAPAGIYPSINPFGFVSSCSWSVNLVSAPKLNTSHSHRNTYTSYLHGCCICSLFPFFSFGFLLNLDRCRLNAVLASWCSSFDSCSALHACRMYPSSLICQRLIRNL
jgi:hypothetical protein